MTVMVPNKLFGSILLIAGTSIGGGMLALPVIMGSYGFVAATSALVFVCIVNCFIALAYLEVILKFPLETNFISIARNTLGRPGEVVAWVCCLLFLYALMVTYISGIHELIQQTCIKQSMPAWLDVTVFLLVYGVMMYQGIKTIDYFNRLFAVGLAITFLMLLNSLISHSNVTLIQNQPFNLPITALPIVFTSFGFLIILPGVSSYLDNNVGKIKQAIIVGSMIPLCFYCIWIAVILTVIPADGPDGISTIMRSGDPGSGIIQSLVHITHENSISTQASYFIFFTLITSFIGISFGIYNILADGLKLKKNSRNKIVLIMLTLLPPMLLCMFYQKLFIQALGYAALFSVIIFGVYPPLMALNIQNKPPDREYRIIGGKLTYLLLLLFSVLIFYIEFFNQFLEK